MNIFNNLPHPILRWLKHHYQLLQLPQWRRRGRPMPPPHLIKVAHVKYCACVYQTTLFVETGTFMGDMLDEVKYAFSFLLSIELFEPLYDRARQIFQSQPHVHILQGDSGELMPLIVSKLPRPALFWLDAHYSGIGTGRGTNDTPILKELKAIFASKFPHLVLIDDARLFVGQESYPTLEEVKTFVQRVAPTYRVVVCDDIIHLLPPLQP
ncbi:MAG TPA: hypothetical protein VF209_00160 [Patescibacteria group bacterium]